MGGAAPIHLAMAIYAGAVYYQNVRELTVKDSAGNTSPDPGKPISIEEGTQDVLAICIAHFVSVILYTVRRNLKTMRCNGEYMRQIIINISIFIYMAAFLLVDYRWATDMNDFSKTIQD